jgi:predicted MFS family arabinose efflux permease
MTAPESEAATVGPAVRSSPFDPRIWLLTLGTFAVGTDNLVIAGILPDVAGDLKVGLDAAGLLVTAYALAYGIGSPLMAAITGRFRREHMVVWAIGVFAAANILCAIAPNYPLLIAARVLAGLAAAVYTPSAYALAVSLASPERRGRALSAVLLGISGSTVLGVPLGTAIGHRLGWHATFILVGLLSAIAMAALLTIRMRSPDAGHLQRMSVAARLAPLGRTAILLALAPNMIWAVGSMAVFTYISLLLSPHFDADTIVALLLVNGVGGLIGSFIGGRLADRFGPVRPMAVCLLGGAVNLVIWGLVNGSLALTGLVIFVYALLSWATGPSQQMRVIRIDPSSAAVTLAINNATFYLGNSLGAAMGGALLGILAPVDLTYVGAAFMLLAFAALAASVRHGRRTTPPASAPANP